MSSYQQQVSEERYKILMSRYAEFQETLTEDKETVRVFDPLIQKQIDELNLIREVSKDLQQKKDEDINTAEKAKAESQKETEEKEAKQAVESAVKEDA